MIELRWLQISESTMKLQFRQQYNGFVGGYDPEKPMPFVPKWTEWQDVPTVKE